MKRSNELKVKFQLLNKCKADCFNCPFPDCKISGYVTKGMLQRAEKEKSVPAATDTQHIQRLDKNIQLNYITRL